MSLSLAALSLITASWMQTPETAAVTIEEERSLYQIVYVVEEKDLRCLRFRKKNRDNTSQSCIYPDDPDRFVFGYYKQAMAANLFVSEPKEILVIGLGGGVLANAFEAIYPQAHLTSVEIDPVVVKMARRHFGYTDARPGKETHVIDGRVFIKRALKKGKRYDLIILDAFNNDYIPEHLMTREFLQETRSLLSPGGIVMANTFSTSKLFHHESATYQDVFGEIYQVKLPDSTVSRVIIASNQKLPPRKGLLPRANQVMGTLQKYGVDPLLLFEAISDEVNWDTQARILTDQFSPANLLKGK